MKLLIVSATELEIAPILNRKRTSDNFPDVDILITGIGLLNMAVELGFHLSQSGSYDYCINAGIAGTFDDEISLGSCFQVTSDRVVDIGLEGVADELVTISALTKDIDAVLHTQELSREIIDLPIASAVTRALATKNESSKKWIQEKYPDATLESLEGASFMNVTKKFGVKPIQIRSVSNVVAERDKTKWAIDLSIQNLNDCLLELIRVLHR